MSINFGLIDNSTISDGSMSSLVIVQIFPFTMLVGKSSWKKFPKIGQNMIHLSPKKKEQTKKRKYNRFLPSITKPVAYLEK